MKNKKIIKILFVCHGNICRSPMAEFLMKDIIAQANLSDSVYVESAAVSSEEIGNSVYPPVRKILAEQGISTDGKRARKMTSLDYQNFELLIGMDADNIRRMNEISGGDKDKKIHLLKEFSGDPNGEVADPWYTGDFQKTHQEIQTACKGILKSLKQYLL